MAPAGEVGIHSRYRRRNECTRGRHRPAGVVNGDCAGPNCADPHSYCASAHTLYEMQLGINLLATARRCHTCRTCCLGGSLQVLGRGLVDDESVDRIASIQLAFRDEVLACSRVTVSENKSKHSGRLTPGHTNTPPDIGSVRLGPGLRRDLALQAEYPNIVNESSTVTLDHAVAFY